MSHKLKKRLATVIHRALKANQANLLPPPPRPSHEENAGDMINHRLNQKKEAKASLAQTRKTIKRKAMRATKRKKVIMSSRAGAFSSCDVIAVISNRSKTPLRLRQRQKVDVVMDERVDGLMVEVDEAMR